MVCHQLPQLTSDQAIALVVKHWLTAQERQRIATAINRLGRLIEKDRAEQQLVRVVGLAATSLSLMTSRCEDQRY
jgi:hypothetical protein